MRSIGGAAQAPVIAARQLPVQFASDGTCRGVKGRRTTAPAAGPSVWAVNDFVRQRLRGCRRRNGMDLRHSVAPAARVRPLEHKGLPQPQYSRGAPPGHCGPSLVGACRGVLRRLWAGLPSRAVRRRAIRGLPALHWQPHATSAILEINPLPPSRPHHSISSAPISEAHMTPRLVAIC